MLRLKLQYLVTWCEELTHWKRPWCWERLKAGGEGDNRGWDGWMASLTQWIWIWASSRSWWWTGKPGVLQSMRFQRVRHDWATELMMNPEPFCHVAMLRTTCDNLSTTHELHTKQSSIWAKDTSILATKKKKKPLNMFTCVVVYWWSKLGEMRRCESQSGDLSHENS